MKLFKSVKLPTKGLFNGVIGTVFGLTAISANAGIEASKHDLRSFLGLDVTNAQICLPCHTPHDADGNTGGGNTGTPIAEAPLWNHSIPDVGVAYQMYSSNGTGTIDGVEDARPTGASALCLGCHDGTVGIDQYTGFNGPNPVGPLTTASPYFVGTDLRGQHPISITYADGTDPGLNPRTDQVTIGGWTDGTVTFPTRQGSIEEIMLQGTGGTAKVQCSSCHDVHNTLVASQAFMLKIGLNGSALCLACHNK